MALTTKRFLVTVLSLVMALALVSVSAGAAAKYQDGSYIGISDATDKGYLMAVVRIAKGAISSVTLTEMTGTLDPKGKDYSWAAWHEAMKVLPQRFVAANSSKIDAFTGATSTSTKAMQAVERALDKALVNRPKGGKYFDGTFLGKSPADDRSYGIALITIKNDKIVACTLGEVLLPDKTMKDFSTYPHENTVKGRITMQERFVKAGNANVDGITGSTGSSTKWIKAVEAALKLAER